jgi:hypothetical protein
MTELTPEIIARVAELLSNKATRPTIEHRAVDEEAFWHVYCGAFDTVVSKREAPSADDAMRVACEPLQRWYVRRISFAETPKVEPMTRNQWCDWVRRQE